MEVYKIIGISEFSFKERPGEVWLSLYCVVERSNVQGLATEKVNVRRDNVTDGYIALNRKIHVYYNRFGKVQSVALIED